MSETIPTLERPRLEGPSIVPASLRRTVLPRPLLRPMSAREVRRGIRISASDALQQRRIFVLLPFFVIAGLIASLLTSDQPEPLALLTVAATIPVVLLLVRSSIGALRALILCAAFWTGFCLLSLHGALSGTPMLAIPAYGTYEARIDAVLPASDERRRLVISGISPGDGARALPVRRARIVVEAEPPLQPGDTIRAPIRFYPVPGPVVPGGHDTQFHAYFGGIGAYGSTTGVLERIGEGEGWSAVRTVDSVRRGIRDCIHAALSQPSAGIATALFIGDQSGVSDAARETMATAGLAHVLSISGLHLTMVAGGIFIGLRLLLSLSDSLARRISVKRLAALGGIAAALLYFSVSGGSVAATRATLMILLVFGAVLCGRRALTMRNVALAALVVLLLDPASAFRPSFQLSFAAVAALIGAWELARHRESGEQGLARKVWRYFFGVAVTSLVAGAATMLFSVYHFQQASPLGVLGNLLSLPLVGFVMMPFAVFAALAMPFGFEWPFLQVMGWSIDRMLELAAVVADLSAGLDATPLLTPPALVLGLAALAWFAFFVDRWRLFGPLLLLPAVPFLALDRPPDVLIADSTQAVAVRLPAGMQVVAGKPQSFAVGVWRETYGGSFEAATTGCDSIACVGIGAPGFRFAIVRDPAGFYEECGADLVIARREVPGACAAATIVDAQGLRRGGVHLLRWNAQRATFDVHPAITDLNRPWRAQQK
ncbi:MAG TPA: ComEC/Rec2 family competence protein [Devosiaceae bacterium]|jgi:competence protein ComEC|nr:ComEC/Rec2 family competence protein [Devosiaceae bacterium]